MSTISTNVFLLAAKKKIRFQGSRGSMFVEDLFDLTLEKLDEIAVELDEAVSKLGKKTFLNTAVRDKDDLRLKFEIVKGVLEFKVAEAAAAKERADKSSRRQFLQNLRDRKQTEQLEGLSLEEIDKQLNELNGDTPAPAVATA